MRGRQILMESLIAHGVGYIFGNPGTTESPIIDSLLDYPQLNYILTLHEGVAVGAASYYAQASGKTGVVKSVLDYKVSSGLTRPDFFDWPKHVQKKVPEVGPQIVVVTFGGNDAQDIKVGGKGYAVGTPEWSAEYGKRVGAMMDYLSADGRTLIWVGIPNAQSDALTKRLTVLRDVVLAEAGKRPGVSLVDAWPMFSGVSGGYADYVNIDGQFKLVRADDGFHLNQTGADLYGPKADCIRVLQSCQRGDRQKRTRVRSTRKLVRAGAITSETRLTNALQRPSVLEEAGWRHHGWRGPVPGHSGPRTKLARTHSEDGMTKADGKQPARLIRLFPVAHARSFGGSRASVRRKRRPSADAQRVCESLSG
jgi:lysophospholipase L1-like esterase